MTTSVPLADERVMVQSLLGPDDGRSLADDVLDGFTRPFKEIPPKHIYDRTGAELFDRICQLPEYYPSRTERAILHNSAPAIAETTRAAELVELGSGTATKTRLLLSALADVGTLRRYAPIDVTETMIRSVATALIDEYPGLTVHGIVGDFEHHLGCVPPTVGPRLVAFLGGTIGNFTPGSRRRFLRGIARSLGPDDHLLLGADLVKDPDVLEAAYDDRAGVTAAFNRNVLHVINRELGADFKPERFEHVAFYDRDHEWIEMRLRAKQRMRVYLSRLQLRVEFAPREEIRTEISAKFTLPRLKGDLAAAGLELVDLMTDENEQFSLSLARRRV